MKDLQKYKELAISASLEAGKLLMEHFNSINDFKIKKDAGIVTKADTDSETLITNILKKGTPEFGILAEEDGVKGDQNIKWIIDPLDGTTNFFHGFPHFNISIALEYKKELIVGVVHNPVNGDIYHCAKGAGSYKNKELIKVSKTDQLKSSLLGTGFAYMRGNELNSALELFKKFTALTHGIRRPGAAALDLCYVAEGIYDGFYESTLNPWDIAAGILLVQEAGGTVTNYKGNKISIYENNVVASNGAIHKDIVSVINS
ncbi:MAG TPA: inositol monophosphatase family protein [bacterium]|nr:inositol monophosphatase family protein [bacterium]